MFLLQSLHCPSPFHRPCGCFVLHGHHRHGSQPLHPQRAATSVPSDHEEEEEGLSRRGAVAAAALILFSTPRGAAAREAWFTESKQLGLDAASNSKEQKSNKMHLQSSQWLKAKPFLSEIDNQSASNEASLMSKLAKFMHKSKVATENTSEQLEGDIDTVFVNSLGFLGSGIIGAFYLLERRAKAISGLALEDATLKLNSKEDVLVSVKKRLERNLLAEKEAFEQAEKAQEVQVTLSNELACTKTVTDDLQKKLSDEKSVVQNLERKIESLQTSLKNEKELGTILEQKLSTQQENIHNLENEVTKANCLIKAKEKEVEALHLPLDENERLSEELRSQLQETVEALSHAKYSIQELENEIDVISKALNDREKSTQDLTEKLAVACGQGEDTERGLTIAQQELDFFKVSSRKELEQLQAKLLSKEEDVEKLKPRLADALKETEQNNRIICDLHEKVNILRDRVSEEDVTMESLTRELNASLLKLETMKEQVSFLSQELECSRELNENPDQRIGMRDDTDITSLNLALNQEQMLSSHLRKELDATKKDLNDTKAEERSLYQQNKQMEVLYLQLEEELHSSQAAAKVVSTELNEQKELAATVKKQLELSRIVLVEARESIKLLCKDVEITKRELENTNKEMSILAEKLEATNANVVGLEAEKALLNESLHKERKLCRSLKETASQVAKLSKQREASVNKAKKLEEELASAKAEALKLKKQVATMEIASSAAANSGMQSAAEKLPLEDIPGM